MTHLTSPPDHCVSRATAERICEQVMCQPAFMGCQQARLEDNGLGGVGLPRRLISLASTVRATQNLTRCCKELCGDAHLALGMQDYLREQHLALFVASRKLARFKGPGRRRR